MSERSAKMARAWMRNMVAQWRPVAVRITAAGGLEMTMPDGSFRVSPIASKERLRAARWFMDRHR